MRCGALVGWVEREASGRRFLIADFLATTDDASAAVPCDDAQNLAFVEPRQIDSLELTEGLQEFLLQYQVLRF